MFDQEAGEGENGSGEEAQKHVVILHATHSSGAEEWYCPTCGRRYLMNWLPSYSKVILEPGDEHAIHSTDDTEWGSEFFEVLQPENPSVDPEAPDAYLVPWEEWMERAGFESWWTRELK